MSLLVLGRAEVEALLDPDELIEAVASALVDLSAGRASVPPRMAAFTPDGLLGAMAGYVPSLDSLAAKLVSVFPHNTDLPTHQAVIVAFDPRTGAPLALLDGTAITAQRTAAASALATRLLARPDAAVLAIVGTGVQAASHARYLVRVRRFREIRVAGRDAGRAARLAAQIGGIAAPSAEQAVRGADVICATTHAQEPVVLGKWLSPGAHLNSVGVHPKGRELDSDVFRGALVAVESRASAFAPGPAGANDLRIAVEEGAIAGAGAAAEVGELAAGTRLGRASREQITVYKSVGVAAEDAAAAALVLRHAAARGLGQRVEI
jgi:ornithine cyclodeaminase